eukprot:CAMPEP_0118945064 /NCGR_PEP_ID=MMETSP1169-20130426/41550_1 /TAXON_ID=36882 /ORGANISM="Pyramimonas obovata, Strain CCMP722" /LENGTH=395 /DNA_ID=CAMNT_0006890697 /DNA_START=18 /DNA_END=1205 /DNA_ORIENTATION=-
MMDDVKVRNARIYRLEGDEAIQIAEGVLTLSDLTKVQDPSYPQVPNVEVEVLRVEVGEGAFACVLTNSSRVQQRDRLEYVCEVSPELTIAIALAEDTAESTVQQVLHLFWNVYQEPNKEATKGSRWITNSDYVAKSLTRVAKGVGQGLETAATNIEYGLQLGSKLVINSTAPKEKPVEVSESTKARLEYAHQSATFHAAVAGDVREGVQDLVQHMAASCTEVVQQARKENLQKGSASEGKGPGPKEQAVKKVGAASVAAFSEVTESFFSAGATVARGMATSTSEVIGHRYGEEAKAAAEKGFGTVGNMGRAAYELSGLGVKGLAKKTAKLTVTNVVLDKCKPGTSGSVRQIEGTTDGAQVDATRVVCGDATQLSEQGGQTDASALSEEEYPSVPV